MPNWNNWTDAMRGAAGGAGLGVGLSATGIGAPLGIPLAAIGAVVGGAAGYFSESPEAERQRRKAELLKQIGIYKEKTLREGAAKINQFVTGQVKNVQQSASKRALSLGRQGEAEAFITPAVSAVTDQGSQRVQNFVDNTTRQFDNAALSVEQDWADRPIDPSLTDVVEGLGIAGLQYDASQKRIEVMKDIYGQGKERPSGTGPSPGFMESISAPVQVGTLTPPEMSNDFSMVRPLTTQGSPLKPRKPTNMVDMYRNLLRR